VSKAYATNEQRNDRSEIAVPALAMLQIM